MDDDDRAASDASFAGRPFFFMHIPKTAGSTLIQIIEQQFHERRIARWLYPFRLKNEGVSFFEEHNYFHGHVEYAIMRSLLGRAPVTITMLRNPTDQYLSQLGNHKRVKAEQIPDWTEDLHTTFQETTLRQFVFDPPPLLAFEARNWQNKQAKMLAFDVAHEQGAGTLAPELFDLPRNYVLPTPTFEQAAARLEGLELFGLAERFQDSLFLMSYTFGWLPLVNYEIRNDSEGERPYQHSVDEDILAAIKQANAIDEKLFRFARSLFDERYRKMCIDLIQCFGRNEYDMPLSEEALVILLDRRYQRQFSTTKPLSTRIRQSFEDKISGRSWQGRQLDASGKTYRWSGPGKVSSVDLPANVVSDAHLRVSVLMAISEEVRASLVLTVNDQIIETTPNPDDSNVQEGFVTADVFGRSPGLVRIKLSLDRTVRPVDLWPESQDGRSLGIAVDWIEIDPVGVQNAFAGSSGGMG
jgi:hypothetical protein